MRLRVLHSLRWPATILFLALLAGSSAARQEARPLHDDSDAAGLPGVETGSDEEHTEDAGHDDSHGAHSSRLTDQVIPLQLDGFPERPKPLLELGEPFLGTGTLKPGITLPTGAVWQPSLIVFGTLRTAAQTFDQEGADVSEAAVRLDLFMNLQLSGTERLLVGVRPLQDDGRFTRYVFHSERPGLAEGFEDESDFELTSLFFEGDFGEIFPNLSKNDFSATDIGFSIGRQPMIFQEGLLISDELDGIGLTRNTLQPGGTSNFRGTLFYSWNEVGRSDGAVNREDDDAELMALLTSTDFRRSTVDADLVYVRSRFGDVFHAGISSVQRIGKTNTAFRVLASVPSGDETLLATDGVLAFSEVSWTPPYGHDLLYVNGFAAVGDYRSAARSPTAGGPLGRAGINFAAVGIGNYGAPLSSQARDVFGAALGYQKFFASNRRQLIVELGGRVGTEDDIADSVALMARYQVAFGRRGVLVLDGFAGSRGSVPALPVDSQDLFGGRVEFLVKF